MVEGVGSDKRKIKRKQSREWEGTKFVCIWDIKKVGGDMEEGVNRSYNIKGNIEKRVKGKRIEKLNKSYKVGGWELKL